MKYLELPHNDSVGSKQMREAEQLARAVISRVELPPLSLYLERRRELRRRCILRRVKLRVHSQEF
jgi:hypothetical protein